MSLYEHLTKEILSGPTGPEIGAYFDLDQTLVAGYSAAAIVRERLRTRDMGLDELFNSLLTALSFTRGRIGFSGFMAAAAAAYRGRDESYLVELGKKVFETRLARSIYPESRALVKAHKHQGHTVAVVSSATPYQAQPFADELEIPHVLCSRVGVKNGKFTGELVRPTCFGEGKVTAAKYLASKCGIDLSQSYFYTDSDEDLPLLEAVGRPRPLNPNRRLAQIAKERQWPVRRFSSRGFPSAEDLLRTGLIYGALLPVVSIGTATGFLNRSRREAFNVMGSLWGDLATSLAGVDLRVEGEEHLWSHRPAVFIFNHQSGLDVVLLSKMLRRDFTGIAKQELRKNPIFGPLFGAGGVVFVDRAHPSKAIEALAPAVEALRHGRSLIIAPEGTRSAAGRLQRFKKGAFYMAMQAGVPIVPIVFRNVLDALPKRALVVRPATVEAVVLPPIDTRGWTPATLDEEIDALHRRYEEVLAS